MGDTVWDTADTTDTLDLMDTTAVTGRGKLRLNPRLMLKPVPMPIMDTMDIPATMGDTVDTTVVLMDMDTDTTVVTGNFPTPKSHLSFRNENIFSHLSKALSKFLTISQFLIGFFLPKKML